MPISEKPSRLNSAAVTRPAEPDKLGNNGGIISGAAAEVEYLFPRYEVEMIEYIRPKARLSIIDAARLIECD